MKITIERASNGAIITFDEDQYSEESIPPRRKVYKFDVEDESIGLQGLTDMFYDIVEELGEFGNKYSAETLHITLAHGTDYECKKKDNCKICRMEKQGE